jgi:HAD superfamily hydrolase (TIGR01509 family)
MNHQTTQIRAVLLDIDGTLIDSNDAHASAWIDALGEFGYDVPFERVRDLIGKGGDKLLPEATGIEKDSERGKQLDKRRSEIFKRVYLPQLRPLPGAQRLLEHMHQQGLQLVVATSAKTEEMDALLEICGADGLIDARTSSEDAEKSKPDPDIIQAALQKAKVKPREALMLGDTPYDIEAAARQGVQSVALRSGGWDDESLAGASAIYDDAADLLAHYDESPFGKPTGS